MVESGRRIRTVGIHFRQRGRHRFPMRSVRNDRAFLFRRFSRTLCVLIIDSVFSSAILSLYKPESKSKDKNTDRMNQGIERISRIVFLRYKSN